MGMRGGGALGLLLLCPAVHSGGEKKKSLIATSILCCCAVLYQTNPSLMWQPTEVGYHLVSMLWMRVACGQLRFYAVSVALCAPVSDKTLRVNSLSNPGAFKTLDKDNNGTIKVNVQEVI